MEYLTSNIIITAIVAGRIVGFFLSSPIFSMQGIPAIFRVWIVIFLSLLGTPLAHVPVGFQVGSFWELGYYILMEALVGASLGLIFSFALNSLYLAGSIIDMGIGFSMVNVFSPYDEQEMPITTNLFYTVALVVFLLTNSHHLLIRAFVESYRYIQIGTFFEKVVSLQDVLAIITKSYIIGIQMAVPFILVMFVSNIVLGVLSRAMPGLNVFSVGMPLNILSGLLTLFIVAAFYFNVFENIFVMSLDFINAIYLRLGILT